MNDVSRIIGTELVYQLPLYWSARLCNRYSGCGGAGGAKVVVSSGQCSG